MLEPRKFYRIENMVRSQSSRVQRQGSLTRHRAALWVLGRRVLPKVPLLVSPEEYVKNEALLLDKVRSGEISIVQPDQIRVDSDPDGTLIYFAPGGQRIYAPDEPTSGPTTAGEVVKPADEVITAKLPIKANSDTLPLCVTCRERAAIPGTVYCSECAPKIVTDSSPEEDPKMCIKCHEQAAMLGFGTCPGCTPAPVEQPLSEQPPVEDAPIEIDSTPQAETPVEPTAAEEVAESAAPIKKGGKRRKSHE